MRRAFLLLLPVFALLMPMGAGAAGTPVLAFSGGSGDYGTIDPGTTASQTFTLTNSGGIATASLKVSISGDDAAAFTKTTDTCSATSLGPKKTCSITVEYRPTGAGAEDNATLTVMSKKPAASQSLNLTGKGTPSNQPPVANDGTATTREDEVVTITISASDSDGVGTVAVTDPAHGTLGPVIPVAPFIWQVLYIPEANFSGVDSFTFKVTDDGGLESNVATVSITVVPVNDAPVANNDTYFVNAGGTLVVPAPGVLVNDIDVDGDPLSFASLTAPTNGTFGSDASGGFTYRPDDGFTGVDGFIYQAHDGAGGASNIAQVTIIVT